MADKFYLMLLANGEKIFGEKLSDLSIDFLVSMDWLEMVFN